MDPDANLKEQRELAASLLDEEGMHPAELFAAATRLAELVQALDEWILKGGFLPADWAESRTCAAYRLPVKPRS